MNTKHRIRVVAAGLLLVIAALTALPVTSGALPIKWRDPYEAVGDPDDPSSGGRLVKARIGALELSFLDTGSGSIFTRYFLVGLYSVRHARTR
jgi:hypothetical protein